MSRSRKALMYFIPYYKPHRRLFIIDLICAFIISTIDLFFPTLTRQVLQTVIPSGEIGTFWIFVGAMVIMYIVRTGLQYVVNYWDIFWGFGLNMICVRTSFLICKPYHSAFRQKSNRTFNVQDGQ